MRSCYRVMLGRKRAHDTKLRWALMAVPSTSSDRYQINSKRVRV